MQKALLLPSKGAPFTLGTRPIPNPGPGEILVKVAVAALNPADYYMRHLGAALDEYPAVTGSDGAGTVEALGDGVENSKGHPNKGDRVLFQCYSFTPDHGTFQQYALVGASRIYRMPDSLSFEEAATFPLALATAAIGLYGPRGTPRGGAALGAPWEAGGMRKSQHEGRPAPALVIGGSSSVGQFALQLLRLSGFSPVIATASAHNEAYVRAAGATHFVDYKVTPYGELASAVARIAGAPVAVVYDAIGSEETQRAGWGLLGDGGALVCVSEPVVREADVELDRGRQVVWVWGAVTLLDKEEAGRKWADGMYAGIEMLLAEGKLKPNRWRAVDGGLGGIPDMVEKVGTLQVSGVKIVARIDETP
ncbi:GroES-like protein [Dentipellis sp. KUC8613]|nr:GroES-like protein [Dentipellis sp. KUC8613]